MARKMVVEHDAKRRMLNDRGALLKEEGDVAR